MIRLSAMSPPAAVGATQRYVELMGEALRVTQRSYKFSLCFHLRLFSLVRPAKRSDHSEKKRILKEDEAY